MEVRSEWIIAEAESVGFDACGIASATLLEEESARVEQWLEDKREGEMGYLTRNKEKRYDPRILVEGTKSIVTVLYNYFPQQTIGDSDKFKIAKYAYGADYHDVMKRKMRQLLERIEARTGKLEGTRVFVDSAPVLDRAWAVRCGLGFIGKNTMLIHPSKSLTASRSQHEPILTTESGQEDKIISTAGRSREQESKVVSTAGKLEDTRVFADPAPVLDRAWAMRCGPDFIGKNTTNKSLTAFRSQHETNLTAGNGQEGEVMSTAGRSQRQGSFFFIGHLFLPLELDETGQPLNNRCGRCTKCIDACPTGALEAPFRIDARKCISYLTIEYKGSLDDLDPKTFKGWMYGCDICQDVCPYNRFALPNIEPEFQPSKRLLAMRENDWKNLDETTFEALFKHSAVQRAGYKGLKRNIKFISGEN